MFKSEVFWSAFGALVAFAGLVASIGAAAYAFMKRRRRRRLQAALDTERRFYEQQARRMLRSTSIEESLEDRYTKGIRDGLTVIAKLDDQQRRASKQDLGLLIEQLRATHATLVEALKPFTTNDAAAFFDQFDKFNQDFGALYSAGSIPHHARTHCGDVVEIVNRLAVQLDPNGWHPISQIANSMEHLDQDLIVPVMTHVLATTEVELALINAAIHDKQLEKALWLKERYRFSILGLYQTLDGALTQMSELRRQI